MSQEIIDRLNELLESERAGVDVALGLAASDSPTFTHGEMRKFAEDEGWACGSLRKAILRYGGRPSDRTGPFASKVLALASEGERLNLMARGHIWMVRRIEALLALDPEPETRALLAEMRDQHLENVEANNRRAEELEAPPGPYYRGLAFAHLCEGHDRIYYGGWRRPEATPLDFRRAYRQIDRYLGTLAQECKRSHCAEGEQHLAQALASLGRADPDATADDSVLALDHALSYAHHALNALLREYRLPVHDPARFQAYHDAVEAPFHEAL